jgi:lysophospholipase L1-like esterase
MKKWGWRQTLLMVIGVVMIALALAATPMGWQGFERFGANHLVLLVFGALLMGIGALRERFPAKRLAALYQNFAALILTIVVVFVALETLSTISVNFKDNLFFRGRIIVGGNDVRPDLPYYQEQSWGAKYWQEHHAAHGITYIPYVLWRDAPFKGETINVDDNGIRLTPGAQCDQNDALKVYVFGGSTVWGDGSPDWGTIPAYLQAGLADKASRPICVVNYGEQAFVSSQDLIQLMLELQKGNAPDVAIFYEGINDVEAAYQTGKPGIHQNYAQFVANLQPNTLDTAIEQELQRSYTYTLIVGLLARQEKAKAQTYDTMGVDAAKLADEVANDYLGNIKIVDGLAQKYGFQYAFFWQPSLAVNTKPLTDQEQAIAASIDPALQSLYNKIYRRIKDAAQTTPHLYYTADALDDSHDSLWIDYYHVTPVGNQIIARKMLDMLNDLKLE